MKTTTKFILMIAFGVIFAWCESATVFYLHELLYPGGFTFPMKPWDFRLLWVEVGREIATILVMALAAILAGRTAWSRFGWYMILHGVWDVFYYVWLVPFEGWPWSPFTEDLLFLVPVPWAAPVLAPVLVSIGLFFCGVYIVRIEERGGRFRPSWPAVALTLAGWSMILLSVMWYAPRIITQLLPGPFRWDIYLIGIALWIAGVSFFFWRNHSREKGVAANTHQ